MFLQIAFFLFLTFQSNIITDSYFMYESKHYRWTSESLTEDYPGLFSLYKTLFSAYKYGRDVASLFVSRYDWIETVGMNNRVIQRQ